MNKIDRIEIVITPIERSPEYQRELQIRIVTYPGGEYSLRQMLPPESMDHFKSMFDHIWESAKQLIEDKLNNG